MIALPGGPIHVHRSICADCQLRATCPISVDPQQCEALERDCAVYHGLVDEEAVGRRQGND